MISLHTLLKSFSALILILSANILKTILTGNYKKYAIRQLLALLVHINLENNIKEDKLFLEMANFILLNGQPAAPLELKILNGVHGDISEIVNELIQ